MNRQNIIKAFPFMEYERIEELIVEYRLWMKDEKNRFLDIYRQLHEIKFLLLPE